MILMNMHGREVGEIDIPANLIERDYIDLMVVEPIQRNIDFSKPFTSVSTTDHISVKLFDWNFFDNRTRRALVKDEDLKELPNIPNVKLIGRL